MRIEHYYVKLLYTGNFLWMDSEKCLNTPICFKINTFSRWPYDILRLLCKFRALCLCIEICTYTHNKVCAHITLHRYVTPHIVHREKANVKRPVYLVRTCILHTIHPVCLFARLWSGSSQPV